ncbi:MAG: UDP-N-acetylmuramoylalanine--D-glutamate ligase [Bacteroidetes bacterium GWF2_43_63]|nr:MAG: UDP-N-acetylmuramoylalanine--D-glutamate ligase [Bacteroidetes bacterium GWE2_42_42]OFY56011.1 MAG: UDP-N-acetylmuramoylalanine--D-glutamate ligase [Bacteroidetes bacterium GWF2_43_63]
MYPELNNLIEYLKESRILIAGFGREGVSTLRFLKQFVPDAQITIGDKQEIILPEEFAGMELQKLSGEGYLGDPDNFDLMIKTPGISLKEVSEKWAKSDKLSSQTGLLLRFFEHKVIGITGTKGKSTTATLIHHLLVSNGRNALLAGNIGLPFFDELPNAEKKTIVAELSSHQLETVYHSPSIAVLLNVFPEHLDHYQDFRAYARAKWNIGLYQKWGGRMFIPVEWIGHNWIDYQKQCSGQITGFGAINNEITFDFNKNHFSECIDLSKLPLQGAHNLSNISAAIGAVIEAGLELQDAIKALYSFKPLPHRLEFIREVYRVKYINDSISTIPQSAIAALKAYPATDTIILGGFNRGIDYSELIDFLSKSDVLNLVLMGEVGKLIGELMGKIRTRIKLYFVDSMQDAVAVASRNTREGRVCMLSPAAASYDKYINFEYRGDDFRKCVEAL